MAVTVLLAFTLALVSEVAVCCMLYDLAFTLYAEIFMLYALCSMLYARTLPERYPNKMLLLQ